MQKYSLNNKLISKMLLIRFAIFFFCFVNKFKEIQLSMQGESLSLLKPSLSVSLQARPSLSQLRMQAKKNEVIIAQTSKRVENYRQQMKNLSKTVNTLIDKQMKKPTKQRPSFHPSYSNPKLNTLLQQKNKLFLEIQAVKLQIREQQVEQPEAIVKQVQSYEANLNHLNIEFNRTEKNKSMLSRELQENRLKLQELNQNSCLIDLSKKEAEFQAMIKQCKKHQKDINLIAADQYQLNSYYLYIKSSVEKEVIEEHIAVEIDEGEMRELIDQINSIYDERKQVERQNLMRIKTAKDMIAQMERNIKNNQIQLREFQNQSMRAEIQSRRIKSLSNIKKQYSTQKTIFQKIYLKQQEKQKKKIQLNPEVKKVEKRIINRIYMIQKDDANCIFIGQWQNIGKNLSDKPQIATNSIEKVKSITFLLNNGKLIGFKSYYVDKSGSYIEGRQLKSHLQCQIRVQVNFQDVAQLQYSRKSQDFYMRFIFVNGSWKQIGQRGTEVQKINLEQYLLKGVQAQINQQQGFIQAFKFILEQKNQNQKGLGDIADRTSSQMSYSNVESIGKRRVILKGKSLKKIKEQPIIDHRLLLNKKL